MILKNASRVLGALASVFLLHGVASAAAVGTGTFNLSGTVFVTNTAFFVRLSHAAGREFSGPAGQRRAPGHRSIFRSACW